MEHLFVYGTLCSGGANAHVLNEIGGEFRKATVKGTWHKEGWGYENHGLRGMVVDASGGEIPGQIFASENLENQWAMLDDFEGSDYQRVKTTATRSDGDVVDVYAYVLKR